MKRTDGRCEKVTVPVFGRVVPRCRITDLAIGAPEPILAVIAPGGFGKSIAASQIASHAAFDAALWLDCSWITEAEAQFPVLLGAKGCGGDFGRDQHPSSALAPFTRESAWQSLQAAFGDIAGSRLCVVLDSLNVALPVPQIEMLVRILRENAHPDSKVLVTTRDAESVRMCTLPMMVVTIGDLEFSKEEAVELSNLLSVQDVPIDVILQLRDVARGQAALLSVLLRHSDASWFGSSPVQPSDDLALLLARLAGTQLSAPQRDLVTLCALLRRGSASELSARDLAKTACDMRDISEVLPLFRLEGLGCATQFDVHDLLRSAVLDSGAWPVKYEDHLDEALRILDEGNRVEQLFETVLHHADRGLMTYWLERRGFALLARGGLLCLEQMVDAVGTAALIRSPSLLLLHAQMLRETFELDGALGKAVVAENLANCDEDARTAREAVMTQARVLLDMGRLDAAATNLERALAIEAGRCGDADSDLLAHAYLAMCYASTGKRAELRMHMSRAKALLKTGCSDEAVGRAVAALAGIEGLVKGRWDAVAQIDKSTRAAAGTSHFLRLQTMGNRGTYLCEMGRLAEAGILLEEVVDECAASGIRSLEWVYKGSLALVLAGLGQYDDARTMLADSVRNLEEYGEAICTVQGLAYGACVARADGRLDEALLLAEGAIEAGALLPFGWLSLLTGVELGYSLMALGDVAGAVACVGPLAEKAEVAGSDQYRLLIDLLLAEAALRDESRTAPDLAIHREYVESESANWRLLQVARTFPTTFLKCCASIGVAAVPSRLLRIFQTKDWERLAHGATGSESLVIEGLTARVGHVEHLLDGSKCRVRLFGGLDVRVGDRVVHEKDWRKRKARVLFALMVLQRGRDMSREQVCDLLWPDLDASRARNNFYVIWSIMKGALVPGGQKGAKLEYADNTGALCRIDVERVDSDVEEFIRIISAARVSEGSGDRSSALGHYRALLNVYRGELLPGDIYDDCFSTARDRYRIEFCDAMRRAVSCAEDLGARDEALTFARAGLDSDPLSEDLYQAVMRYYIESGQRGAAIDVYVACRERLCDDLGLDPSSETMRLYERILGMDSDA